MKQPTMTDLLDVTKKAHGWTSDYRLMKELNFSQQKVSAWRNGRAAADEAALLVFADALEIPRCLLLLLGATWRTKCPAAQEVYMQEIRRSLMAYQIDTKGLFSKIKPSKSAPKRRATDYN